MSTPTIIEITREHNPFPRDGIRAGEDGIPRYEDLPSSLVALLQSQVDARGPTRRPWSSSAGTG